VKSGREVLPVKGLPCCAYPAVPLNFFALILPCCALEFFFALLLCAWIFFRTYPAVSLKFFFIRHLPCCALELFFARRLELPCCALEFFFRPYPAVPLLFFFFTLRRCLLRAQQILNKDQSAGCLLKRASRTLKSAGRFDFQYCGCFRRFLAWPKPYTEIYQQIFFWSSGQPEINLLADSYHWSL